MTTKELQHRAKRTRHTPHLNRGTERRRAVKEFMRLKHGFLLPYDEVRHDGDISVRMTATRGQNLVIVDVTNVDKETARMIASLHHIARHPDAISMSATAKCGPNLVVVNVTSVSRKIAEVITGLIGCLSGLESSWPHAPKSAQRP